ncbi:LacI family DNA-binding transcriptional regulator [Mucisphaera sp.]|uniref:LacI family DNA-binding transcriptional regulator n=1 Tax=Mucisphaera sp. TaxID=2913024 RepID=UPI003D11D46D
MASVREIAKLAGVSTATVSRVLNNHPRVSDEARQRVMVVANESRYVPTVGRRSTGNIAFMYTDKAFVDSPFDASVLQGVFETLEQHELDLVMLHPSRGKRAQESYSQMLMRKGVQGVILRTTSSTRETCEQIASEGFPAVVVGDRFENSPLISVDCPSRDATREAVEHLIELGHRRIALARNLVDDTDHQDREAGYRDALRAAGLQDDDRLILTAPAWRDSGAQMIRRIMTMTDRPTALVLTDPISCIGAMNECRSIGLEVPEHLSMVGFDDSDLRYSMYPVMSAVCQNATRLGREAVEVLASVLNEPNPERRPERTPIRAWFEVNGSTGPAPQSV